VVVVAASVTIYVSVALAVPVDVADKVFYLACPDVCYENCLARVHKRMGLSLLSNEISQYCSIHLLSKRKSNMSFILWEKFFLSPLENQLVPWILSLLLLLCRLEFRKRKETESC